MEIKVFVYYPKEEGDKAELEKIISKIHAQYIIDRLKSSPYSKDQKIHIIDTIINKVNK